MTLTDRITQLVLTRRPEVGKRGVRNALIEVCHVSPSALSQWFDGTTGNVRHEYLLAIAVNFNTTVDWLLAGEGEPPLRPVDLSAPGALACPSWKALEEAINAVLCAPIAEATNACMALYAAKNQFVEAQRAMHSREMTDA
jgi:transcriptional regulator with XRE-family HTH domain